MAKVNFKRYNTKEEALASDIIDGNYIVTKDGGNYADFDGKRVPIGGTPDTEMSDTSENSVQNKVVKKYVDDKFDKLSVYSTEEKVIGKWIDGKPIYRQVIEGTTASSNSPTEIGSISNLGIIVDIRGYIINLSQIIPINFVYNTEQNSGYKEGNNIIVRATDSSYQSKPCYVIVEYTKTTE